MKEYIIKTEQEMYSLAAELAEKLEGGEIFGLIGNLGAGKTTFVRGIVKALGVDIRVKSPTFTVMNEYPINKKGIENIIHMDLYRFQDPVELEALAFDDVQHKKNIIFIEWPDMFEERAFPIHREIHFEILDDGSRKVTL